MIPEVGKNYIFLDKTISSRFQFFFNIFNLNQLYNYLTKFQNLYQRKAKISFTKFPLNRNKVYQQKFKFSLKLSCLQVLAPSPRDESNHRSIWHFSTVLGPTRQVWWDVKKWEKNSSASSACSNWIDSRVSSTQISEDSEKTWSARETERQSTFGTITVECLRGRSLDA